MQWETPPSIPQQRNDTPAWPSKHRDDVDEYDDNNEDGVMILRLQIGHMHVLQLLIVFKSKYII